MLNSLYTNTCVCLLCLTPIHLCAYFALHQYVCVLTSLYTDTYLCLPCFTLTSLCAHLAPQQNICVLTLLYTDTYVCLPCFADLWAIQRLREIMAIATHSQREVDAFKRCVPALSKVQSFGYQAGRLPRAVRSSRVECAKFLVANESMSPSEVLFSFRMCKVLIMRQFDGCEQCALVVSNAPCIGFCICVVHA